MKLESTNSIWGIPLLNIPTHAPISVTGNESEAIEILLQTFLSEQIAKHKPDLIIVVERKGTAILRSLNESAHNNFDWPWSKVISSEAIEQMSDEYFRSKRILVFDDMMKTASHIRNVIQQLSDRELIEDKSTIRIAVFAVHEACPSEIESPIGAIPYSWFYRNLTSVNYQSIQIQIVGMLQQSGSLMLDTEHLEVRLRLLGSLNRIIGAVKRKATAYPFHSSDGRMNITVFYDDDEAHSMPAGLFPVGASVSDVVKKCRIIDRGGDEYAIIPICFPSIIAHEEHWPTRESEVELLGSGVGCSDVARFYGAGLLAALEVLYWVLKDLAVLGENDYSILLPKYEDDHEARGGYTLEHLKVVFPTLNVNKLTDRIAEVDREARLAGTQLRSRKFESAAVPMVTDAELHQDATRLLQVIRHELDQRILESEILGDPTVRSIRFGLTLVEIFEIGKRFGWDRPRTSALCDILIDQAAVSTDVIAIEDPAGIARMVRTFAPAGEVVSEMVRRYSTQWGLPL